jgi:DNA-3-methyladenine glycosylase
MSIRSLLKRNFYNRPTTKVAQDLLGCFLVSEERGKITRVRITETEAYRGEYDLASHASRGRTPRTETMYGEPGRAYIYMIYGMYFMLNVVTEEKDFPAAVLIRGVRLDRPLGSKCIKTPGVCFLNGPGKLTKFLHIDKKLNGHDLTRGEKLWLERPENYKRPKITKSPRTGIEYARHCRRWKWNFKLTE